MDARLFDDAGCLEWLLRQSHPQGPACPHCGRPVPAGQEARFWRAGKLRCACGKWFTGRTGTVLEGAQLAPSQVAAIAFLGALGVAAGQVAKFAGVDPETVRRWWARLAAPHA
ncbi:MAG: transposase [Deltaproteobacteria bacterium]|nr:transposase [Deltaproteobacteria bacterium]